MPDVREVTETQRQQCISPLVIIQTENEIKLYTTLYPSGMLAVENFKLDGKGMSGGTGRNDLTTELS